MVAIFQQSTNVLQAESTPQGMCPGWCRSSSTAFKLVVPRQSPLKGQEDLEGKLVGAVESSRALKLAQAIPGIRDVRVFPHDDEMYAALADGTVDVIVSPSVEYAWRNRGTGENTSIGEVGEPTEWGFGVKKGNAPLLDRLDQVLDRMKEDGSLEKLQGEWLCE
ncbi:MAG: transporter substrate-binding domain-containing protein [Actinobacteria bacterium]|nr:transporter substrate-binding domain-containing protein [Actinomycetota bacterium]MBU1942571.1 transporter substrate-binding domain-containing protein [Actinomycetota bacterium]MBU2688753.1 transporter substrate-binding domain-containing protein [Actinomycetota bacterium]